MRCGSALRSAKGFVPCGDVTLEARHEHGVLLAVIDGLGHGPDAAESAHAAREAARRSAGQSLRRVFEGCDTALAGLRGAVMSAIAVRDGVGVRFAGIGNVELFGPPGVARPVCVAGMLGRGLKVWREYPLEVVPGHRWVLASDGVRVRDAAKVIADAAKLSVTDAATQILQHAGRDEDDVGVLVVDFVAGSGGVP